MNPRQILIAGMIAFAVILLFPPWNYVTFTSGAVSDLFGGTPSTNLRFRPIWSDEYVYSFGEMVGSNAEINYPIWFALLGAVAFATFVLKSLAESKDRRGK